MPSYSGPTSSYSYYPSYYSTPFFSSGYSGGYSSYYSRGSSYSSGSTAPSSYSAGNDCSRLSREAVRDLQASRTRYRGSKTDTELTLGDTGCLACTNNMNVRVVDAFGMDGEMTTDIVSRSPQQVSGAFPRQGGQCDPRAFQGERVHPGKRGGEEAFRQRGVGASGFDSSFLEIWILVLPCPGCLGTSGLGLLCILALLKSHRLSLPEEQRSSGGASVKQPVRSEGLKLGPQRVHFGPQSLQLEPEPRLSLGPARVHLQLAQGRIHIEPAHLQTRSELLQPDGPRFSGRPTELNFGATELNGGPAGFHELLGACKGPDKEADNPG